VDPTPVDGLTDRELEVLYCIAWGMMNLEIGSILGISSRTVEIHRAKMIAKLNARTSSEAVRIVMTSGFSLNLDDI
jgi:two-component system response regulator FixJ